jgi:glycosyltransferase involved in cell wall biosynthesis
MGTSESNCEEGKLQKVQSGFSNMEASPPEVSICIPAYNYPYLLERCLRSVIEQTYINYEVIISDDSSHDQLKEVVQKFNDPRISYFKNPSVLGSPANWNEAISYAKGKYIKILHHDDWFANNTALAKFVKVFKDNPDIDFAFSSCYNVTPTRSVIHVPSSVFLQKLARDPQVCLYLNGIGAPSVTMFKNIQQNLVFDTNTCWYVDVIFYVSFLKRTKGLQFIKEPLLNVNAGSANQVTHLTPATTKVREAVYAFWYFDYFKRGRLPLLMVFLFAELFRRYGVKNVKELENMGFGGSIIQRLKASVFLSRFPVNFKIHALIRRIIVLNLPAKYNCY